MEPSDLYNKSKRNLAVFTAFLALVVFGSVAPEENAKIIGFKLDPGAVPTVLFFVVMYLLWQLVLARYFLSDDVRGRLLMRLDFGILVTASVLSLCYFLWAFVPQMPSVDEAKVLFFTTLLLSVILTYAVYRSTELLKWRREAQSLRQRTLADRLREPGWMLHYNPGSEKALKPISFEEGGRIGQGQNSSEHRWSLEGNMLTITREGGELQNVFRYEPSIDQFRSVADPHAKGIQGQTIFRISQ